MIFIFIYSSLSLFLPNLSIKLAEINSSHQVPFSERINMPLDARLTLTSYNSSNNPFFSSNSLLSHNQSRIRDMFFDYIRFYLSHIGELEKSKKELIMKVGILLTK